MEKLDVSTLVRDKKSEYSGIGCVYKKLKNHSYTKWGENSQAKMPDGRLEIVDTSMCGKIEFEKFRGMLAINSKDLPPRVIIGNEVVEYVGIGSITIKVVEESDLSKYPMIVP